MVGLPGYCSPPFTADPVIGRTHPGSRSCRIRNWGKLAGKKYTMMIFLYFRKPNREFILLQTYTCKKQKQDKFFCHPDQSLVLQQLFTMCSCCWSSPLNCNPSTVNTNPVLQTANPVLRTVTALPYHKPATANCKPSSAKSKPSTANSSTNLSDAVSAVVLISLSHHATDREVWFGFICRRLV